MEQGDSTLSLGPVEILEEAKRILLYDRNTLQRALQEAVETTATLKRFPPGTRLIIDVVLPEQYKVGWIYGNKHYLPEVGSYYPLAEAFERATAVFDNLFPGEMDEVVGEGQHEGG